MVVEVANTVGHEFRRWKLERKLEGTREKVPNRKEPVNTAASYELRGTLHNQDVTLVPHFALAEDCVVV